MELDGVVHAGHLQPLNHATSDYEEKGEVIRKMAE